MEAQVGGGKPSFCVVGLPDRAVREAKDRVRAALASTGYVFPARRVTVNLAPADMSNEDCGSLTLATENPCKGS